MERGSSPSPLGQADGAPGDSPRGSEGPTHMGL